MRLTKYEHACFSVENDGQLLVVDPGEFTTDFIAPSHVVGVVITHEHADHFDQEHIAAIVDKNPNAVIIGHSSVLNHIKVFTTKSVVANEQIKIGSFTLEFFGGEHAVIHPSIPPVANLGVFINDILFYPGDSFTLPGKPVDTLALPVGAPWLKMSDTIDYLTTVQPRFAFPTHDAVLSIIGRSLPDRMLPGFAESYGGTYYRIEDSIEI